MTNNTPRPEEPATLPALVRARDLKAMGLTRTDAERVMRLAGTLRVGKAVYAKRDRVLKVLNDAQTQGFS